MLFTQDAAPGGKVRTSAKKNVLTILVALIAAAAVFAAVWLYRNPQPGEDTSALGDPEKMETVELARTITAIPYMSTDFSRVFYTADAAGNVLFYEFNGSDFVELPETGAMSLTVPLSGQQIPVTVHYIERDGSICGYGVYSVESSDSDVYIYSYMFFKVTDLPTAYAQSGRCLLLANSDRTDAYAQEPVWEEAYVLDRSDNSLTRFLSENNRTLGMSGAMRADFCMVTDEALTAAGKAVPFFSSRSHEPVENGETPIDIYTKNDSRETSAALNVAECYVKPLANDAFAFIRETAGGFQTVRYEGGEETVISNFYSAYGSSYIRSGDYILSKEDGRVYTTYDDTVITPVGYQMNPMEFAVSPDGKYVVMAGTVANALDYRVYVYNTETGRSVTYDETNYAAHSNMRFIDDTTVMFFVANVDGYENVVLDVRAVR